MAVFPLIALMATMAPAVPGAVAVRATASAEIVAAEANSAAPGERQVVRQVRAIPGGYLIEFS